jgi:ADP-heptose:LPS heptosyltransferase
MVYSSRAKLKAGRDTDGYGWFFNLKVKESLKDGFFEGKYNVDMVRKAGFSSIEGYELIVNDKLKQAGEKMLANRGIKQGKLVGICCGGVLREQRWDLVKFRKLIHMIIEKTDYSVLLLGDKSDCGNFNIFSSRIFDLRGETDIKRLIGIIYWCDIFISNDTGPMHLACGMKKKVIALFRSKTFRHFAWQGKNICNLVGKKVNDIAVEEVWECFSKFISS